MLEKPGASSNMRQFAVLTVAKLGDASHFPLLESLLNDHAVCAQQRIDQISYQTQVRDVALAAMVHIAGQDPRRFGFPRIMPHKDYLITTDSLGFANDKERQAALDKWTKYRESSKENSASRP